MGTQHALHLPGSLISQIEAAAEAEHINPDRLLQNLLAKHLGDKGQPSAASVWREGDWYVSQCLQLILPAKAQPKKKRLKI